MPKHGAPPVVVIMGVSGSGKTTVGKLLADRLHWQFADADQFHPRANIEKMSQGVPLTDHDRAPWLTSMREAIANWLKHGQSAVLACSALKNDYRDELCVDKDDVAFVYLHGDLQTLSDRMKHRQGHFMKADMLKSQFATLEEPTDALRVEITHSPTELVDEIIAKLHLSC